MTELLHCFSTPSFSPALTLGSSPVQSQFVLIGAELRVNELERFGKTDLQISLSTEKPWKSRMNIYGKEKVTLRRKQIRQDVSGRDHCAQTVFIISLLFQNFLYIHRALIYSPQIMQDHFSFVCSGFKTFISKIYAST